ncbi:hypothetical protein QOT17_001248 [Balamuthia mandrillaris]
MMVFDFDLQLQAFNNASRYWNGLDNFVEFCTPATDGQGNFYFYTESGSPGVVFAIRFPENELLWNRSMAELDPFPGMGLSYQTDGSPSLSEDGTRLFVTMIDGGVAALDTSNGDLVWATAISDIGTGEYYAEKLVPTVSPVDGTIITHWRNTQNNSVAVVGLDAETGEKVHFVELLPGSVTGVGSPGSVTADGVYYLSVYNVLVAVDLESFEVLWSHDEEEAADEQSISIAADGSVYIPRNWDSIAVLRCKENYALDASGKCSKKCVHANARFIGRNLCGYDCGEEVALLFPLVEPLCGACQENQYWSSEELACEECPDGSSSPAGSIGADACVEDPASSEDGDGSGSNRLQSAFMFF